ncbi:MAG: tryptophan-rich sensory protein [Candidatus Eisenbacteria bacterium]|nr:tryptophan-rich sensory protein [Candidatus Eisenbacteria bacterium]
MKKSLGMLVLFFAAVFSAAAVGSIWMPGEWYASIAKPAWTPPNALFGPVWTALYAMMAVAAWLVWRERGWRRGAAPLGLFGLQLLLNAAWTGLFFGLRRPDAAFVEIVLLWISIAATALLFRRVRSLAAVLLLPYLAWVGFAAALNLAIWVLNR